MDTNRPRLLFLLVLSAALGLAGAACGSADDSVVASVGSATLSQAEFEAILGEHDDLTSEQITSFVLDGSGAELHAGGLQANLYERGISVDPRFGVFDPTLGLVGPAISVIRDRPWVL